MSTHRRPTKQPTTTTQTTLPFLLFGAAAHPETPDDVPAADDDQADKEEDENKIDAFLKEPRIGEHACAQAASMDMQYVVPRHALTQLQCTRLQAELHMKQKQMYGDDPIEFDAYEHIDPVYRVPRYYGIQKWGLPPPAQDFRPSHDSTCVAGLTFAGTLRPDSVQQPAHDAVVAACRQFGGATLVLPCGAGKTVVSLCIAATLGVKTLVLLHQDFLVSQWEERITAYLPHARIGRITARVHDVDGADIVLGSIHTVYRRTYDAQQQKMFGLIIVDECHHIAARQFSRAMTKFNARYTLGLSATPERRDGLTRLVFWVLGPIVYRAQRARENTGVTVRIIEYSRGSQREIKYKNGHIGLPTMLNIMCKDRTRNGLLLYAIRKALSQSRKLLVLSDRVAHLRMLCAQTQRQLVRDDAEAALYIGGMKQAARETASRARVIFGTYVMVREALDIPELDTLVLATPKPDVVQAVGRILRQCDTKQQPLVIDFYDPFSLYINFKYARERYYRKMGYALEYVNAEKILDR